MMEVSERQNDTDSRRKPAFDRQRKENLNGVNRTAASSKCGCQLSQWIRIGGKKLTEERGADGHNTSIQLSLRPSDY